MCGAMMNLQLVRTEPSGKTAICNLNRRLEYEFVAVGVQCLPTDQLS